MTPFETANFLRTHDNYLILTHARPDGDTIGSAAGLCLALRQLGKTAHVLPNPETTSLFVPYLKGLLAPEGWEPDTVVAVDMAARSMCPANAEIYLPRVDLTIDHHPSQEFFAKETCLDASCAACGELIYTIISQLGPVSCDMATALYVAVSTDCGCFQYGNTTADTHRIAAALMDCGIPTAALNKRHFRTKSWKRMQLESAILSGMELHENGTIALAALTIQMMDTLNATEDDTEDIAALVGQLEGVKTSVTIREKRDGTCKISMRTAPDDLNANHVCALLGGGGHAAASGATLSCGVEETKKRVLDAIEQVKHG